MIIGIDASRANVPKKTGTEWYAYHLIQEFKKIADPRDQFILYAKEPLTGELAKLPPHFKSKVLAWPPQLLWTQLRLAWEMLLSPPDVLFVPAHTIPTVHPKLTVTTIHDVGFERYHALYSQQSIGPRQPWLKKTLWCLVKLLSLGRYGTTELDYHRWSARLALRRARTIITVSHFSKSELVSLFRAPPEKIIVVYNAPSPLYKKIIDPKVIEKTLEKFGILSPFFLSIGRLEEKKNTAGLIEGFAVYKKLQADNRKLVLAGQPGHGYEKIKALIAAKGMTSDIVELGWVDATELVILMKAAEVFVFPSAYEGFGIPIIEAMQCGTPVITSNTGAMKEIADSAALLVHPHHPHEIAAGLQTLVTNHQKREELIAKGRGRASQFSWEKSARETLQIIKRQDDSGYGA